MLELLIEHGARVNEVYYNDYTALHIVAGRDSINGQPDPFDQRMRFVQLLVEHGARVDARDDRGRTALDRSRDKGFHEVVWYLEQQ